MFWGEKGGGWREGTLRLERGIVLGPWTRLMIQKAALALREV